MRFGFFSVLDNFNTFSILGGSHGLLITIAHNIQSIHSSCNINAKRKLSYQIIYYEEAKLIRWTQFRVKNNLFGATTSKVQEALFRKWQIYKNERGKYVNIFAMFFCVCFDIFLFFDDYSSGSHLLYIRIHRSLSRVALFDILKRICRQWHWFTLFRIKYWGWPWRWKQEI